jgi:hypothetical protein
MSIGSQSRHGHLPNFTVKKGFCSAPIFEILSAPYDKQRKVNLHEPLFYRKPIRKWQMQQTGSASFHRILIETQILRRKRQV